MPVTLALIAVRILLAARRLPLGLWAALTRHRVIRHDPRLAIAFLATPPFYLGLLLILSVAVGWEICPPAAGPARGPENIRYVLLPAIALAGYLDSAPRPRRSPGRAGAMQEQFIEAAIARRLPARTLVVRHVLPNSLLPVITLSGTTSAR